MRVRRGLTTMLAVGSLTVAACGSGGATPKAATSATSPTSATPTTSAPAVTTTAPSAPAVITVADNPTKGKILVGSNGHTLYLFEKDQGTTSACVGACAQVWPALTATGTPAVGPGVTASKV